MVIPLHAAKQRAWIIGIITFIVYAWFFNGVGNNHTSRLDAIFSVVERGSLQITPYTIEGSPIFNTTDWAANPPSSSRRYSNKAPGPILLGIPVYWLLFHLERRLGLNPVSFELSYLNSYLINLVVTVLPISLSLAIFFYFWRNQLPLLWVLFLVWTMSFATLIFPFSTQLWGHVTATAFVILALALWYQPRYRFWMGMALGWAVLSEYICIIFVGILTLLWVSTPKRKELLFIMLGGSLPALIYIIYHEWCFSSLLPATTFNNPIFKINNQQFFLFSSFTEGLSRLWGLTFSPYRGLFWYMPILILVFPSLFLLYKRYGRIGYFCIGSSLLFFLTIVSFSGWHGGWSTGPRYLIPILPCLTIFIVLALYRLYSLHRHVKLTSYLQKCYLVIMVVLLTISISHMWVISSVCTMAIEVPQDINFPRQQSQVWKNPLFLFYQAFWHDHFQILVHRCFPLYPYPKETSKEALRRWQSFILGHLIGLPGKWGIFPAFLLSFFPWFHIRPKLPSGTI